MGKRQLPTLVRLSLIVFFFFFFVHDNEAEYFLSIDGRVGKNEFTDVSFHAGCLGFFFFFLRLEIGFVHKPPTRSPRCSSPIFIQRFHSRFLSIALLYFHGSALSPLSAHGDLLSSLSYSSLALFFSLSFSPWLFRIYLHGLSRPASLVPVILTSLTFSPGKSFPWIAFNLHRLTK